MLPTPFGELSSIDINERATQQDILFYDKHQLLEGLVAENHVDQILEKTVQDEERLVRLNVTSVLAGSSKSQKRYVLVLDQGCEPDLLRAYLSQLTKRFIVKLVRYDEAARDFVTHPGKYVEDVALDGSYGNLVKALNRNPVFIPIAEAIKDPTRQKQGFWGQLVGAYGDRLGTDVVLPRIFKNFAIQPYFDRGVWDIDRVFWDAQSRLFSVFEVKHKFPSGSGKYPLSFGINVGSVGMLLDLAEAGFRCFHTIMVKPYWNKGVSVTFLFNNLEARKHVLFCGKNFDRNEFLQLSQKKAYSAPSDTSLTGSNTLPFVFFDAVSLFRIGLLDDPDLSRQFALAITEQLQGHVTDDELRSHKLSWPPQ
ncbi:hypothetical protein [Granulicella sp. L60]|uniref:hypothetical protein n=1 Tax=Granulicella sp. L60 TaxID=1641866 RepID=UPI00131C200A|nr:hypothetical protein [Granulicella sp. L60]